MKLFDSSVWIDYLNKVSNPKTILLVDYLKEGKAVYTCSTIIQEVLQGIRDDNKFDKIQLIITSQICLQSDPIKTAVGAAELYRNLRKKGITIRKSNDCLIAYYAISNDIELVHNDSDFDLIAQNSTLKVWTTS